jgi:signal transduction histidine kinase
MPRLEPAMNEKTPRSTRLLLIALVIAAALAVPGAMWLASTWAQQVESLSEFQPEALHAQGVSWGSFYRQMLESWRLPPAGHGDITTQYAEEQVLKINDIFRRHREITPNELTVLRVGPDGQENVLLSYPGRRREHYPPESAYVDAPEAALRVALEPGEYYTDIVVLGPLRPQFVPEPLVMRCVLRFVHVRAHAIRGRRAYFAAVGGLFVFLLYAIFVTIHILARGEVSQAFRAKEKEIRLRAMGQVAEGIAHEVRNPLNAVSLMVQYLERLPEKSGQRPSPQDFQRVYFELGKIRKVIDNFVSFAKLRELELSEWDVGRLLDDVLMHFDPVIQELGIKVQRESRGDLLISGDRPKLEQVLRSVVENAVEAVRTVAMRELLISASGGKKDVTVAIRDSGEGVSDQLLAAMFDPFVSTRPSAMGLGLTIARTVVESHGGSIQAAAAPRGCVVTVVLPRRF